MSAEPESRAEIRVTVTDLATGDSESAGTHVLTIKGKAKHVTKIRTAQELLALPAGTVVERPNGAVDKLDHERSGAYVGDQWFIPRDSTVRFDPLTVLHRPDLPTQAELHAAVERVRALHTDSPAGFCPSCVRLQDISDTDDGLVAYPCATIRALDTGETR